MFEEHGGVAIELSSSWSRCSDLLGCGGLDQTAFKRCIEIGGEPFDGGIHTPATSDRACFNLKFEAEQKCRVPEEKCRDGRRNGRNAIGGDGGRNKERRMRDPASFEWMLNG
jgi:hypothetical protein